MVASDSFAEFLHEQLAPLGRVTMRRMFGKTGVFCDGLMFGMVTDDTLYFRVCVCLCSPARCGGDSVCHPKTFSARVVARPADVK